MISFDEALSRALAPVCPMESERVAIGDARGRVLSEHVHALIDAPRADIAAMDGYAVRLAEARSGEALTIVGEAFAGTPFTTMLGAGQAVRIFTGAHVPKGADCVVMQEYAQLCGDTVSFAQGFGPGRHIRERGGDFAAGAVVIAKGTRLSPAGMIALAGADVANVAVARQPRVAIIVTGDELVAPGSAADNINRRPDSASFGVTALAERYGAKIVRVLRAGDDLKALEAIAAQALSLADLVIVIGGASVGKRDFAKSMFAGAGLELAFSKVAIKPGKPVWFGTAGGKHVLGLPGNPGSALVTARLVAAPVLTALQGGDALAEIQTVPLPLVVPMEAGGSRETFVRAYLDRNGINTVINQESGAQAPMAEATWLIRRAAHDPALAAGALVRAIPL
ncbi:molybdopterin molybdotransferase MoeA [Qipengyuania flava]|uniref:molybdopterin molybdotransferase MoeA n=1 Tax=Qipengyuania flava TaxID=192812 RepID=UPI001CD22431|nr:molybdopterin molybdotransferase MoeA [Qipengyuania flava]MCA0891769.1 molybdopterin molybdotransferase MoeA [Qipengyuania flava]